jgi:hypothetical protein
VARFNNPGIQGIKGDPGAVGGYGVSASYWSTIDQTGTNNSIQAMTMNNTDWETGVSLQNGSQIHMPNAGKYNIAFSAQFHQTNSSSIINIWLSKEGVAVPDTNTKVTITANNPYVVAAWNFFVNAEAGTHYEIMWSANSSNAKIEHEPAGDHPAVPSVIVTVNQVG